MPRRIRSAPLDAMGRSEETRMPINSRRVVIGGFVAGVIITISGLLMVPVVGHQMEAVREARNVPPMGSGAMVFFGMWSLVLGVLLVWLYAAVRRGSGIWRGGLIGGRDSVAGRGSDPTGHRIVRWCLLLGR